MRYRMLPRSLLATVLATSGGCDLVAQLPVITSVPPTFDAATPEKILAATITQNNGQLNPSLRVRCVIFSERPPQQLPAVRSVAAQALAGNTYNCVLPDTLRIRNNHVLLFEWLVESINEQGEANPVARSGVKQFHVGCADPAQFLRNDQAAVLGRFAGVFTTNQLLDLGYVPTHPAVTTIEVNAGGVPVPTPFTGNKVFRGMGVAFARAADILAAGNFVPSGLPVSGQPNLLLMQPSTTVAGRPDLAPLGATFTLLGWAYAVNLSTVPGPFPPDVGCFPLHEWFFHEAGVHTLDGGFTPSFGAPGVEHDRLWDVHVWSRASGLPELGILNVTGAGGATTPGAGFDAPAGSFFHPDIPLP